MPSPGGQETPRVPPIPDHLDPDPYTVRSDYTVRLAGRRPSRVNLGADVAKRFGLVGDKESRQVLVYQDGQKKLWIESKRDGKVVRYQDLSADLDYYGPEKSTRARLPAEEAERVLRAAATRPEGVTLQQIADQHGRTRPTLESLIAYAKKTGVWQQYVDQGAAGSVPAGGGTASAAGHQGVDPGPGVANPGPAGQVGAVPYGAGHDAVPGSDGADDAALREGPRQDDPPAEDDWGWLGSGPPGEFEGWM